MAEKKPSAAVRAWRILRMALLWARKGGAFRRWRLMLGLRVALKSLRSGGGPRADRIRYMERELSFDETPTFSFRMSRPGGSLRFPRIPCIGSAPPVDDDECDDWMFENRDIEDDREEEEEEEEDEYESTESEEEEKGELGIDVKAEEFISKFYEQMKLQRQISWIRYDEIIFTDQVIDNLGCVIDKEISTRISSTK